MGYDSHSQWRESTRYNVATEQHARAFDGPDGPDETLLECISPYPWYRQTTKNEVLRRDVISKDS